MKRSRKEDDYSKENDQDTFEKDIIITNLRQKLLEAETKIENLSSFSLNHHQIENDLFQYSYTDPLIHYEFKTLNERHNFM
jgi:hypothetical protein